MGDRLKPAVEIEELVARFEQNLATWLESFRGFLDIGDHDSLEILLEEEDQPVVEIWDDLSAQERERVLGTAGELLGVDLLNIRLEKVMRRFHSNGVPGEKTEGGAEVEVLGTKFADLEVHVLRYQNPELGTRYDLVRSRLYA